jgi:hypothetical protein
MRGRRGEGGARRRSDDRRALMKYLWRRGELDRHYARHPSLLLKLRIAMRTNLVVLVACGS